MFLLPCFNKNISKGDIMSTEPTVRLLTFNPAMSSSGWSVSDYKLNSGKLSVYRFGLIKPSANADKEEFRTEVQKFGKRTISLEILRTNIIDLVNEYKPDYVIIEDEELDVNRPNSYTSLMAWILQATIVCHKEFGIAVHTAPSRSVSLCLKNFGARNSVSVRHAVDTNPAISFKQKKQAEIATDKEYASVGLGFYFVKEVLPSLLAGT